MSEGLAQGSYVVARVGFEPATFQTQGTELTTEPPSPTMLCSCELAWGAAGVEISVMWIYLSPKPLG